MCRTVADVCAEQSGTPWYRESAGRCSASPRRASGSVGNLLDGDVVGLSVLGGPAVVSIFRPAIIGSQHTPWLLEKVLPAFSFVTPAKYKSITVDQIAKAMIAVSLNTAAKSAVYHYSDMMALNR